MTLPSTLPDTLPDPTTDPADDGADPVYTSFSAYRRALRCPREWSYRYGPHRIDEDQRVEDLHDMKLRGNVLHDAIAAALIAAGVELAVANRRQPLPGTPLTRYWPAARRELGVAWDRYRMPSDRHTAAETVEMLTDCLAAVRVPQRGAMVGVEAMRTHVTPGGLNVRYVVDWAYWDAGRLVILDWKSGIDDPERVEANQQLLCYAVWLAADLGVPLTMVDICLHNLKLRARKQVAVPVERALTVAGDLETTMLAMLADPEPAMNPGPGCVACFARRVCPEMAGHYTAAARV